MKRWIFFSVAIMIGGIIGLVFGWVINPVDHADTTPDKLRVDFRSDYVLMTAEAYQVEQDLAVAIQRLSLLGGKSPNEKVHQAITFATQAGYTEADIALMQNLADDLDNFEAILGTPSNE